MLPAYSVPLGDSGATMAAKSCSMGCARHQARMNILLNPPSASIELLVLCSQDVPVAISTAVEAPVLEKPDPLQQEVDPRAKVLVSSRGKGSARLRHHPTHMPAGGRVDVHHFYVLGVRFLNLWTHIHSEKPSASQLLPLAMEKPGDKSASSASLLPTPLNGRLGLSFVSEIILGNF